MSFFFFFTALEIHVLETYVIRRNALSANAALIPTAVLYSSAALRQR